jgi:hypothetical protein
VVTLVERHGKRVVGTHPLHKVPRWSGGQTRQQGRSVRILAGRICICTNRLDSLTRGWCSLLSPNSLVKRSQRPEDGEGLRCRRPGEPVTRTLESYLNATTYAHAKRDAERGCVWMRSARVYGLRIKEPRECCTLQRNRPAYRNLDVTAPKKMAV